MQQSIVVLYVQYLFYLFTDAHRQYLIECPILEIREACGQLFDDCLRSLVIKYETNPTSNQKIVSLITSCVQLLDKAVIDLSKNSHEYFKFLLNYAEMVSSKRGIVVN